MLTGDHQRVILPDLNAGCSMADMANIDQVEEAWDEIARDHRDRPGRADHVHELVGGAQGVRRPQRRRGVHVVERAGVLEWAFARGDKVLFFPDQHLGRNTGYTMGYDESDMRVWDPRHELGGLEERDVKEATFLLWKGHCSVHQRFTPAHVEAARAEHPGVEIVVHPECAHDVVEIADKVGSTERIQEWVQDAAPGTAMAVGTEIHMVQRLAREHPDKTIVSLDPLICPCSTMFRIDAPHLAWVLEYFVPARS